MIILTNNKTNNTLFQSDHGYMSRMAKLDKSPYDIKINKILV